MSSNYSMHAAVWDWAGYDRAMEFEFWSQMASRYGNNVLSLMSALGETGAFLACEGFNVTALDYTEEMVMEGRKRYSYLQNLEFFRADARDFDLNKQYDFCFIGSSDLHHFMTKEDIKLVVDSINKHLRKGGGLGLELWYPAESSWSSPIRKFEPFKNVYADKLVWKEGKTEFDFDTMRIKISQTIFQKYTDNEKVDSFNHDFELQLYNRDELLSLFMKCGFSVKGEYGDYKYSLWEKDSPSWLIELVKN